MNIANQDFVTPSYKTERLTRRQKMANKGAYYKEKAFYYEQEALSSLVGYGNVDERKRMQTNYDLFNNIFNVKDLEYVCKPFGEEVGELPATMSNKDISSYRIKAILGMEGSKAFGAKVIAVNPEATTRKEEELTRRLREYIIESITAPIRAEAEIKYKEQLLNKELTAQERQAIMQQMQAEIEQKTPERVRNYMKRKHQDPSEIQGQQILNYLQRELQLEDKFKKGWKHANLSAYEVYYVGLVNNKPIFKVVNPMRFSCHVSPDNDFIEQGEWAVAEYKMPPSQVVRFFKMSNKEIDEIFTDYRHRVSTYQDGRFFEDTLTGEEDPGSVTVKHIVFRSLRKIGYLYYQNPEDGEVQQKMVVDDEYKLDPSIGDIRIEWEYKDEISEIWKIGDNIWKNWGPVQGQIVNEHNLDELPLPYVGAIYDRDNSLPTCPMDRMKVYQYYYNIILYKVELLMASDEGKKILMNIGVVPKKSGINVKQWMHYFKSSPLMWYNPQEPGMNGQDVNTIAKVLDLSLISDISKYIELAEYIEQKCGKSVGVTDPVLGQTAVSERVTNNQQNLVQTGYILQPYFDLHLRVKHNALQHLLNLARIAYLNSDNEEVITNVLDDMSVELLKIDKELLALNNLGIYVEDSTSAKEIKESINNLVQAALQNQKVELSEVFKVLRHDSITEASHELEVAEEKRQEREAKEAEADRQHQQDLQGRIEEENKAEHEREKEIVILKEKERRKTIIQQQAMLSAGFNEDKDMDGDGQLDLLEIANQGINANIAIDESRRKDRELAHKIDIDNKKVKIEDKKASQKTTASK